MAPLRLLSVASVVALAVSPLASARLQPPNADASSPSRVRLVHGLHSPLWVPQQRVDGDALVSLTLALHSATPHEELDALVHAVSDVMSPQYGQFLSAEDLARHAAPSVAASTALRAFLHGREIHATESKAGDYVTLRMRVALAEQLFQTTLIQYAHESDAGVRVIRPHAAGFSVPQEIAPHVLFIDGLESLPTPQQAQFLVQDGDPFTVTKTATVSDTELLATPSVVRAQYEVPTHWNASDPNNTIVIAQFLNEYYAEHDLSQFLAQFEPSRSTVPSFPHHTGDCLAHGATRATGEASLDVQVVVALSHSDDIEMLCFQSLRDPTRAFADDNQEPFLAFLQAVNAMAPRPAVVSISYTDEECAVPEGYREAVNRELMKAALQGISILISAGDGGAQGSSMSAFCGVVPCSQFVAMFPASSPYVTAVGATTLNPATRQPNGKYGERVTSAAHGDLITSGGGFSNVFAMPAYQKKAAATYLAYADAHNLTGLFNPAGRAYPDVAALGHSFPTVQNGQVWRTDGTSVSAPIVASLVALLNRQRLATGRPVLGFLNPLLYQLYDVCPHVFTDITDGDLACAARGVACCAAGHAAIPGWDAASGVGTLRLETLATELDGCIEQIRSTSLLAEESQPVSLLQRDMTRVLAIERIGLVVTLVAAVALVSVLVSMRGNVFPGRRFFEFQRNEPARERLLAGNHN